MNIVWYRRGWSDRGTIPLYVIHAVDSEGKKSEFAGRKPEEAIELFNKAREYKMRQARA